MLSEYGINVYNLKYNDRGDKDKKDEKDETVVVEEVSKDLEEEDVKDLE